MNAKEWLDVIMQAEDTPRAIKSLIVEYGNMRVDEIKEKDVLFRAREAIANYMWSEGCSCCEDTNAHREHEEVLGKLLKVKKYDDSSGYDFPKYRSK